ncbi:interleukin-6 receptor subunit beta isoform X2 [Conger conger]|uniref:interleukin-6 receptor subunit beta isoform X2 n=1 Tax=Conger conger TaxID=82655 RepID=UPI002A5A40B2|nr:interleukin-6 receptor subunit beta isoform X2 [Conger conger]
MSRFISSGSLAGDTFLTAVEQPQQTHNSAQGRMSCIKAALLALAVGVCISADPGLTPSVPRCVFMSFANVTCQWEPGVNTPPGTRYVLHVNENGFEQRLCQTQLETRCSVPIDSLNWYYCIWVTAKSAHAEASSPHLCIKALHAAKLYAPNFTGLTAISGNGTCLEFRWSEPEYFPLTKGHVAAGLLAYQLEYSTEEQSHPRILELDLRRKVHCRFSPFTLYTARIRYRYHNDTPPLSHWSDWSGRLQARTEEGAPSIQPQLWRLIERVRVKDRRQVTLLWKPLPKSQANGVISGYRVWCWKEPAQTELDPGGCRDLLPSQTSCQLLLPPQRCSCALSAGNSAGQSPAAVVTIPSATHKETRSPVAFRVGALDDFTLTVLWDPVPSASGFVVEWRAASDPPPRWPRWRKLGPHCSGVNVSEGVRPKEGYAVSVRAEFGAEAGPGWSVLVYTRQGAPSAGPRLHVAELGSRSVFLQWDPIPLEQRHGFVRNYTLYCESNDHDSRRCRPTVVPEHQRQCQLSDLSGVYSLYMTASTDAGQGAAGPPLSVVVKGYTVSAGTILSCSILPLLTGMVLFFCLRWRQRIKYTFWPWVPDPSQSSLSLWISGKAPVDKMEAKESKDPHAWSSTNKELLFDSEPHLSVLDSVKLPIGLHDPPWPGSGQSVSGNAQALPLLGQYVRHAFVRDGAWPAPPPSSADTPYTFLVATETQEQGTGF